MTKHAASQCQNVSIQDGIAYSLWAEPPQSPQTTSDDEMVLTLRPAELENIVTHLVVTCGKIQIQTSPEPTTFDLTGKTIVSVKLGLAASRAKCPELNRESFKRQLLNKKIQQTTLTRPTEGQTEELPTTFNAFMTVPIQANIDRVDMRFDATVITDVFPLGICLGAQKLP